MMIPLNLPEFKFSIRKHNGHSQIFDPVRKRYVSLTPEEWVRQNFVAWLIHHKNYPSGLIGIEKEIMVGEMKKRFDVVIYNKKNQAEVLIECKAPGVAITQKVFDQISVYNMAINVRYLIITNGMDHYCCTVDTEKGEYSFMKEVPVYSELFGNN